MWLHIYSKSGVTASGCCTKRKQTCAGLVRHDLSSPTYVPYDATGPDSVVDAQPALVVRTLSGAQHILVAHVVRPLIDYPESCLHPDGVAAAEVPVQVAGVAVALIESTLEVFVLVEDDLEREEKVKT